jgi:uncharacterized protein (TIGR02118 family)
MVRLIILLRKRPGLPDELFRQYWRETHAPLVAKLPGLRRYVQSLPIDAAPAARPNYDGVAELWFDSVAALQAAFDSPEDRIARADTENFADMGNSVLLMVEEQSGSV